MFGQQLNALLWRNILIKKKKKRQTLVEILLPMYFVAMIVMINRTNMIKDYPEISEPTGNFSLWRNNIYTNTLTVGLVPINQYTMQIKSIMNDIIKSSIIKLDLVLYNSTEELVQAYQGNGSDLKAGVVFADNPEQNGTYSLKLPFEDVPSTSTKELYSSPVSCRQLSKDGIFGHFDCPALKYYISSFSFLQVVVDSALLKLRDKNIPAVPDSQIFIYPKPAFRDSGDVLRILIPLYMVISMSPLVANLLVGIVFEKEKKIKESMLIMGMHPLTFWISWFLVESLLVLVLAVVQAIIIGVSDVLPNTNMIILFAILLLYGLSLIMFAFMLTPFFDKAKTAGTVCGFIVAIFSVVHLLAVYLKDSLSSTVFYLLALLSPAACGIGLESIVELEASGYGFNINNMFSGKFSPGSAIIMLVIDIILYGMLAVYFDLVIPGEFGSRYKPWFFLLPSTWKSKTLNVCDGHNDELVSSSDIEPVPEHLQDKLAIKITQIEKTFTRWKGNSVKAVQGIDLNIYEDQITAILGHNGAGKTTLINMLVGMTSPTAGSGFIYNLNIADAKDMSHIRSMMGICLQENILIEELTCHDHLMFFAKLKGVPENQQQSQVNGLLKELHLLDCQDTISKSLSGGQKRKLCVGIALIGDPKIIFLDEPSSGVDPYSRRQMWYLLQKKKMGRVIVLTTHFMDEADILADRKAIVSQGKIRCVGSSFFLKSKFGIGYHLIAEGDFLPERETAVTNLVKSHIEAANLSRKTASELSYVLPLSMTDVFPQLFSAIEDACSSGLHGLKSYGVSMTTLEEVFIALGEDVSEENNKEDTASETIELLNVPENGNAFSNIHLQPSWKKVFLAFFHTRILLFARNYRNISVIVITPLLLIIINYFMLKKSGEINPTSEALKMSANLYPSAPFKILNETGEVLEDLINYLTQLEIKSELVTNLSLADLRTSFVAVSLLESKSKMPWEWLINDTAVHYLPVLQNILTNFYGWSWKQSPLQVYSDPFPSRSDNLLGQNVFNGLLYGWTIMLASILGYLPPTIAIEVVEEREARIKNQLRVSGLTFGMYWLVTALTHAALMLIPVMVLIIGIVAMDIFGSAVANLAMAIVCLLFIPSSLIYTYVLCFIFDRHDTAKKTMPTIAFFVSFIPMIVIFMVQTFAPKASTILHIIFSILFPLYCPSGGLFFIVQVNQKLKVLESFHMTVDESEYFKLENNVLPTIIILVLNVVLYLLLLRVLDVAKSGGRIRDALFLKSDNESYTSNPCPPDDSIADVKEERQRVETLLELPVLMIKELGKCYYTGIFQKKTSKVAVRNLSLAVESGHIFGLLGPNGAGKTSTMKMVISDESPTYGKICVGENNVTSNLSAAFRMTGYCPQHDALWDNLTVTEHIQLYSGIRGIDSGEIDIVCTKMINGLNIEEHANKKVKELSGGTKRKLSYIISMIGSPQLVLLDEPSTGMDPQSKRFLWDTICKAFPAHGSRSVLLTTHSMEEADILCTRIGIMVNGYLKCLGSSQYLKNTYGSGYTLDIKLSKVDKLEELTSFVKKTFPGAQQKEAFGSRISFVIPKIGVLSIAKAFASVEEATRMMEIEEYSFSQTTLEQVFLEFAKEQEDF